jgi:hypothetical protein
MIPLLMENMSWPPIGSMGPIFSEYLFIRFFQRAGEKTDDNRVWPVAKFQEMLMQLNFYGIKPEESLIEDSKFFMIISHDFGAIHSIISSFMLSLLTTANKDKTHCHKY